MRTDCTIDGKQVICRNATLLGFATCKARVGSYFVYHDGTEQRMGRMLGRVAYAPALQGDTKPIVNHILAMVWFPMGHCCERWINPADVIECYTNPPASIAAFFFAPKIPYDAQTMRRLMEHGTCSDHYIEHAADNVAEFRRRDAMAKGVQS